MLVCQLEGPESFSMWASVIVLVVDAGRVFYVLSTTVWELTFNYIVVTVSMVIWATVALYHAQEANPLLMKIYRDSISYFLLNCCEFAIPITMELTITSKKSNRGRSDCDLP